MKLFISYSSANTSLTHDVASQLAPVATVKYWDRDKTPGDADWQSIFRWIDECDAVVVIISDGTIQRGISVGQEIGYAKKAGKLLIPLVAKNIAVSELGYLKGLTAVHYDTADPGTAILELKTAVETQFKRKSQQEVNELILIGGFVLFLLAASKS